MTVELIVTGKTDSGPINDLVALYMKRVNHYIRFSVTVLPEQKKIAVLPVAERKAAECAAVMKLLTPADRVVLLDKKGSSLRSVEFAAWMTKRMNSAPRRLVFVIGGAYGFSPAMYDRADFMLSMSPMTFSHQVIRVIFMEQLYRAFTIINGEPYHNE